MTTKGVMKENFRRRGLSGWQKTMQLKRPPVMPEEPTRWHRMLYTLGIEESQVEKLTGDHRKQIIAWIRRNVDSCYVPQQLLNDLSIKSRYE